MEWGTRASIEADRPGPRRLPASGTALATRRGNDLVGATALAGDRDGTEADGEDTDDTVSDVAPAPDDDSPSDADRGGRGPERARGDWRPVGRLGRGVDAVRSADRFTVS